MGRFVKGDVVVLPFPFSDFSGAKRRPALVVATLSGDDLVVCQITSQVKADGYSVAIRGSDLTAGNLHQSSNVRPNRLFTADSNVVLYRLGTLDATKVQDVINKIVQILTT